MILKSRRFAVLLSCLVLALAGTFGLGYWLAVRTHSRATRTTTGTPLTEAEVWQKIAYEDRRHVRLPKSAGTVSLDDVIADYRRNEFAAAAKYENGRLEAASYAYSCYSQYDGEGCRYFDITAVIRDLGRDRDGRPYLSLSSKAAESGVTAIFAEGEPLEALSRGQRASVRCMVRYDGTRESPYGTGVTLTWCAVAPGSRPQK